MFTIDEMLSKRNQRDALAYLEHKGNGRGADGMPLTELAGYWRINGASISSELKSGKYIPGIVKTTEIVNNKGKRRSISSLNTIDRFITRLLSQKLRRYMEPESLEHSYAYQDGKGVQQAVEQICSYVNEGGRIVVEIDLKDYFDSIPQDRLMKIVESKISDRYVVKLIHSYVRCRVMTDGKVIYKTKGIVQGNSISPVLSNLYLHSLDELMESKGYRWIRFADNIYVYTEDEVQAENILNDITEYLTGQLGLEINERKSGIYNSHERYVLGYELYRSGTGVKARKHIYKKVVTYKNWHESALQKVNSEYHIIESGVLNKKDYSLLFENDQHRHDIPIGAIEQISIYSDVTVAPSAIRALAAGNIRLIFVDAHGDFIGDFMPAGYTRKSTLFLKQAQLYQSKSRTDMALKLETAGIHNMRANIRYYRKSVHGLDDTVINLTECIKSLKSAKSIDDMMLIEARARHIYYSAFNLILKQDGFRFDRRSRRPPMDRINAMISFGNTLLYNYILRIMHRTSVDPRIGIVHATNGRMASLNLDFADIFKPLIVDRTIFSLINMLRINPKEHFRDENKGVYLNDEGKRLFIEVFEDKLGGVITVNGKHISYSQLILREIQNYQKYVDAGEKYRPYKYW